MRYAALGFLYLFIERLDVKLTCRLFRKELKMRYNAIDVSRHIINYSNKKNYGISNLKLQKILYFVQAYFLLKTGSACFDDRIEAWDLGPVVPVAYREYKIFGNANIPMITFVIEKDSRNIWNSKVLPFNDDVILEYDKELIDSVVDKFSEYSASDLVRLTHNQQPWIDAYSKNKNNEISRKAIEDYFNA